MLHRSPLVSLVCLALLACQPKPSADDANGSAKSTKPDADAPESPDPSESNPPNQLENQPVRAPIVFMVDARVWRLDADGQRFDTGVDVPSADPSGGTISTGDNEPAASVDGARLAYLDGGNVKVASLVDGEGRAKAVTNLPAPVDDWIVAANPSFSSWSPDGSTLVVFLIEPSYLDEAPLDMPEGLDYGAHVLSAETLELAAAPHIEGYMAWLPDSSGVVDNVHAGPGEYTLTAYPIAEGPPRVIRETADMYGFGQLHAAGDRIAWVANGPEGDYSEVLVAPFAGGEPTVLSPRGRFAELQWPILAPGGAAAVVEIERTPTLCTGPGEPASLAIPASPRWDGPEHLIGITDEGLVRVDLDGETEVLATDATDLVRI